MSHEAIKSVDISPLYYPALDRLKVKVENGVTVYNGGPLEVNGTNQAWLWPIDVDDKFGHQAFHLIGINVDGKRLPSDAKVDVMVADEITLKLGGPGVTPFDHLMEICQSSEPKFVLRPVIAGMNSYPRLMTPLKFQADLLSNRITKVLDSISCQKGEYSDHRADVELIDVPLNKNPLVRIVSQRMCMTPKGPIVISGVIVPNDPWGYYEVLSPDKLSPRIKERIHTARIDSGCDSGQIYHDALCECREQLHGAVAEILKGGAVVVHEPEHDGRGCGTVIKMETEALKRGVEGVYQQTNPVAMSTVEAGELVLGSSYDIRTYHGAGIILRQIARKNLTVITDNLRKLLHLEQVGLRPKDRTAYVFKPSCDDHVRSKHESGGYIKRNK